MQTLINFQIEWCDNKKQFIFTAANWNGGIGLFVFCITSDFSIFVTAHFLHIALNLHYLTFAKARNKVTYVVSHSVHNEKILATLFIICRNRKKKSCVYRRFTCSRLSFYWFLFFSHLTFEYCVFAWFETLTLWPCHAEIISNSVTNNHSNKTGNKIAPMPWSQLRTMFRTERKKHQMFRHLKLIAIKRNSNKFNWTDGISSLVSIVYFAISKTTPRALAHTHIK